MNASYIIQRATALGFDLVGFAPIHNTQPTPTYPAFLDWLAHGYQAEMAYLARSPEKRAYPRHILPDVRHAVVVGVSYDTLAVPQSLLQDPSRGRIARYAWSVDYHDELTPKLRALGEWLDSTSRAYVDTGPVLERSWAQQAGLGFIGKNTCLIHSKQGSYLFLGVIFTAIDILRDDLVTTPSTTPSRRGRVCGCGNCTRCLTACPTHAFVSPYVLNSQRCISYLTIEHKGSIPEQLRPQMGNWIFGCDVCQEVCPYVRRFSLSSRENAIYPADLANLNRIAPKLLDVLSWDKATFNSKFKNTALARPKRRGVVRNACVAAGNWGDPSALPVLHHLLSDEEALVREHAQWAIQTIMRRAE
jgi:epoxyqueuosine reductase